MSRARVLSLERRIPRPTSVERFARIFNGVMTPEERRAYFAMAMHNVGTRVFTDKENVLAAETIARMNDDELRGMARRLGSYFVKRLADHERFDPTCGKCAQRRERAG